MEEVMSRFTEMMLNRRMYPQEIDAWWDMMELCEIEQEVTDYLQTHPEIKYNGQVSNLIRQIAEKNGVWDRVEKITEYL